VVIEWRGKWTVSKSNLYVFLVRINILTAYSSPMTWITGVTTLTQLLSRTTMLGSSSRDTTSRLMGMAPVGLMGMVTCGILLNRELHYLDDQCLLCSGMCPMSAWTISTSRIPSCGA
jgi:hypothetical protein